MNGLRHTTNAEPDRNSLSDLMTVLPRELVTEVFRQLDFPGRLAVSHVCSSWRRIALSTRRLWAEYRMDFLLGPNRRQIPSKTRTLAWLLARSAPLPFRLECGPDVPDEIAELVLANLGRMAVLDLGQFQTDDALLRLLAEDAPLLRHISFSRIRDTGPPVVIPARWAEDDRLHHIGAECLCVWPRKSTFRAVRSFSGFLPQGPAVIEALPDMFPNLKYLSLHGVTQNQLNRLEPLPPLLQVLKLRTDSQGVDCAALLRGCTSLLRELTIDCTRSAACVLEVFRLFERTVNGPWALYLYGGIIDLRSPPSGTPSHRYDVFSLNAAWLACPDDMLACCGRLQATRLGMPEFYQLCAAHALLPALDTATVVLAGEHEYSLAAALDAHPGISAPALRTLTVSVNARLALDAHVAAAVVHTVHALQAPPLAWVVLCGGRPGTFSLAGLPQLGNLAARVEAWDRTGRVLYVFESDCNSPDLSLSQASRSFFLL